MLIYWLPHTPMYLLNLAQLSGNNAPFLLVCQHLPSGLKCSYVSQKPQKYLGAWGPNRCWDIDFPSPPCICSTWPSFWVHWCFILWVCQHLPSGLKYFYVSQKPPKNNLVHGALIDAEILTSPLLNVFAQTWPRYQVAYVLMPGGVPTPLQVVTKCSYSVSETSKIIWCMGP